MDNLLLLDKALRQGETFPDDKLVPFLRESLQIEGIFRGPTEEEIEATRRFMTLFSVSATAIGDLQAVYAPGHPLRERQGMDVAVGRHVAPRGGPAVLKRLQAICRRANKGSDPWTTHVEFEALHPFMDGNGRSGRALWAWHMHSQGHQPFSLPFLHRWYYQTLANRGPIVSARWK